MGGWRIAEAPNGKKYYWRGQETKWEEPPDYENGSPWMEAESGGRTYYYHMDTQETRWDKPEPGDNGTMVKQEVKQEPRGDDTGGFVAGGGRPQRDYGAPDRRMERRDGRYADLPQKPSGGGAPWEGRYDSRQESRHEGGGFRGAMPVKTDEPEFDTREKAEEAFFKLLRRNEISPDASWKDVLKQVVQERDYRAIKDPLERQQAFEKYCRETREQEKDKEMERRKKLKEDFRQMLSTHDEIRHYTRWKTARPMVEREAVFKSSKDEALKRQLFEDYIRELKIRHDNEEQEMRLSAKQDLNAILAALIHDPDVTWTAAREMIENNERFANEKKFRTLSNHDVLRAFDIHMKMLDRQANDKVQQELAGKTRRERKARDGFKALLAEKRAEGLFNVASKWKDLHPLIADDERYQNLLATHGSSPLDLFRDMLGEEEGALRSKRYEALDVLEDQRYEMTVETPLSDFVEVMKSDSRTAKFDEPTMSAIFDRLMDKVKKRAEDDKAQSERHQRKAIDALRSVIKRLDPPVRAGDAYEDVVPKMDRYEEFKALSDEARRSAFDKYIRRLKDKDEDLERDRSRRDRDPRASSRRYEDRSDRGRRTRSPEHNAYEADRRKAQADRERLGGRASFGLSPPPRDRRDERDSYYRDDRYRRRDDRDRYEGVYERERREREMERERSYISRADPRDVGIPLHYGDEDEVGSASRPGSVRKRRESDDGRKGESKRRRRTPEAADKAVKDEEPVELQSGSEEGEIEEV